MLSFETVGFPDILKTEEKETMTKYKVEIVTANKTSTYYPESVSEVAAVKSALTLHTEHTDDMGFIHTIRIEKA